MKLSIIMPVYNEIDSIENILFLIQQANIGKIEKEIIIVDDLSNDGSREFFQKLIKLKTANVKKMEIQENKNIEIASINIHFQDKNYGKGAAIQKGFQKATGDIILIQDADLEYDPNDYMKLITPIIQNKTSEVFGSRYLDQKENNQYFTHKFANWFLTLLFNVLNNQNLTDMETCYKVFSREILEKVSIEQNRFGIEPKISAKISKLGKKIIEVPISYYGRKYDQGKKSV